MRGLLPAISKDDRIKFIFDDQIAEKRMVRAFWNVFMKDAPQFAKNRMLGEPAFENDIDFKPLQAADLLAWWIRRRYLERNYGLPRKEFPRKIRTNPITTRAIFWTEDKLVEVRNQTLMSKPDISFDAKGHPIIRFGPLVLMPLPE